MSQGTTENPNLWGLSPGVGFPVGCILAMRLRLYTQPTLIAQLWVDSGWAGRRLGSAPERCVVSTSNPLSSHNARNRTRKHICTLALMTALTLGYAPVAHASTLWAALVWTPEMKTGRFQNYPEMTQLVLDTQNWAKNVGYQTFSSGHCGAVATYTDPFGNTKFSPGTGRTRDEATSDAMRPMNARLLDAFCQD